MVASRSACVGDGDLPHLPYVFAEIDAIGDRVGNEVVSEGVVLGSSARLYVHDEGFHAARPGDHALHAVPSVSQVQRRGISLHRVRTRPRLSGRVHGRGITANSGEVLVVGVHGPHTSTESAAWREEDGCASIGESARTAAPMVVPWKRCRGVARRRVHACDWSVASLL